MGNNIMRVGPDYFAKQAQRIEEARAKLAARPSLITNGRVLPADGDLALGEGRRMRAAVLFLDTCGFSARLSETLEEQDTILRTLHFFFPEMFRIVEEHGGYLEKNTGDGLMAYFNEEAAGELSVSQHALGVALLMFRTAKFYLNPTIAVSGIEPIAFRACIDTGNITVADIGAARRFRGFVAVGATANVAGKLVQVAGRNTILVGEKTLRDLDPAWSAQFVRKGGTGFVYRIDGREYPCYELAVPMQPAQLS